MGRGWPAALAAPQIPASAEAARSWLAGLVDATAVRYLGYGHGDEHVIKFADTAADVYARTGDRDALAAAVRATQLIDR
jgi:hypothetical protein